MSSTAKTKPRTKRERGDVAVRFLGDLRPEGRAIMLTAIIPDGPTVTRTFTDPESARRFIVEQNAAGKNVYFTVNLCSPADKKPKKSDLHAAAYLHADADPNDDETPEAFKQRMDKFLANFDPPPTFTIDSGNGYQFLWELKTPFPIRNDDDIAAIESRNHALAIRLGAAPSTKNVDRILRVPGTVNYPNAKKKRIGRTECRAKYLDCNGKTYRLENFPEHIESENPSSKTTNRRQSERGQTALPAGLQTLLRAKGEGGYASRSELLFAYLTAAIRARIADEIIIDSCIDRVYAGCGIFEHVKDNGGRRCAERQLVKAREMVTTEKTGHSWEDPDRSLLDDRRGELPEFPVETIRPDWLRDWIKKAAHGTGTTAAHVAVPMLGISSGLIGASRKVQASTSWSEPCTMWTAVIGFSGSGKSPGIDATRKPLAKLERERQDEIAELRHDHEQRVQLAAAAAKRWKENVERSMRDGRPTPPMPENATKPAEFITPRLFTTDVTVERMALLLQARPQGLLLLTDELAGWSKNMSRYSGGTDNQFWLMAWDGREYVVERMGRPPVALDNLLIGVVGGLQPDRLAIFDGAADGMSARFLYAWPGESAYRPLSDTLNEADPDVVELLDKLSGLPKRKTPRVPLSKEARAAFEKVRKEVYEQMRTLDGLEREWLSKAPAQILRLAGTLAYLRWAVRDDKPEPKTILERYILAAAKLILEFFWPHARAALRQVGLNQSHGDERRVLRWLAAKKITEVSREQVRREALGQRLDADRTTVLLDRLVKAGWLRQIQQPASRTAGRKKQRWEVNPLLNLG
jgi:hypothetical protein